MQSRGLLPEAEVQRRMQSAVNELQIGLTHDYYQFVVNDTFVHTAQLIDDISTGAVAINSELQAHGREVAEKLLSDTKEYLK